MNKFIKQISNYSFALGLIINISIAPGTTFETPTINVDTIEFGWILSYETLVSKNFVPTFLTQEIENKEKLNTKLLNVTAYSSTPDQTDDSPFISASGEYVYDGMIAANFLPFGTKVKIPELFGDKIFTVDDRMNRRYQERVDIWFPDRQSALNFGIKTAKIIIL